jgi:hypothetical protein
MDALARLEPVARPLLRQIDDALATLGAPPGHQVWSLLRQVRATPADAVTAFAEMTEMTERSGPLRAASEAVRAQVEAYAGATIPASVPWAGGAGEAYADQAAALATHLRGAASPDGGDVGDSMTDRLEATASYVDEVAAWQARARGRIARALADVLSSAQAVSLRAAAGKAGEGAVLAAADAGAHLLAAAADALTDGRDLHHAWSDRLTELPYRAPNDSGPGRFDTAIHLRH